VRVNPDVDPRTHAYTTTGKRNEVRRGHLNAPSVCSIRAGAFSPRVAWGFQPMIPRQRRTNRRAHSRSTAGPRATEARATSGRPSLRNHLHIGLAVNRLSLVDQSQGPALIDELRAAATRSTRLDIGGGFGAALSPHRSAAGSEYAEAIDSAAARQGPAESFWNRVGPCCPMRACFHRVSIEGIGREAIRDLCAGMNDSSGPLCMTRIIIWPVEPGAGIRPQRAARTWISGQRRR